MKRTVFMATAKKVTSTQKPDQAGRMLKHVQVVLEFDLTADDEGLSPDLMAIQDAPLLLVTLEPQEIQPAEASAGFEL